MHGAKLIGRFEGSKIFPFAWSNRYLRLNALALESFGIEPSLAVKGDMEDIANKGSTPPFLRFPSHTFSMRPLVNYIHTYREVLN